MITKKQEIEFDVYVFAIPKDCYEITEDSPEPYKYEVFTYDISDWDHHDGAILVSGPTKMTAMVNDGVNLTSAAINDLQKKKDIISDNALMELSVIDDKIQSLLALPSPE